MSPERALRTLPEDERRVMTLRKVYGYRQAEIAVRLHMDEQTVAVILAKAVRHMADALERETT